LSQEEKDLAIARIKSERVATTEVLDRIDSKKLMRGIFNPVTLGTSFLFLLDQHYGPGPCFLRAHNRPYYLSRCNGRYSATPDGASIW
jgi:hypothetical protein